MKTALDIHINKIKKQDQHPAFSDKPAKQIARVYVAKKKKIIWTESSPIPMVEEFKGVKKVTPIDLSLSRN